MKQSQLKQIIKEEVQKVIIEETQNAEWRNIASIFSHYLNEIEKHNQFAYADTHEVQSIVNNMLVDLKDTLNDFTLTEGAYEDAMANLNTKVGVKVPTAKNTFKEKEFKVEYWQYINDEYDFDFIIVKAKDEADALVKAKEELKKSGKRNVRYDKLKVIK